MYILHLWQLGYGDLYRSGCFGDYTQCLCVELDADEAHAGHRTVDVHAVGDLLEFGQRRGNLRSRVVGEGFEIENRLLRQRFLEIRHCGAGGGAEQAKGRLRFNCQRNIGEPQDLALLVERRFAPDVHRRLRAEAEPALFLARLHAQRDQQPVAGCRQVGAQHLDVDRPAAVIGEVAALELLLEQLVEFGKRHVDRHADCEYAVLHRRHQVELRREGAGGLRLAGQNARFRLHADSDREVAHVDLRLRRRRTYRAHLQPERRQSGLAAAEWNGAAHLHPLLACAALDHRIAAQARLQRGDLAADHGVKHRLDFIGEVDLDAREIGAGVAEVEPAGKIGFDPPGGGELRPRRDDHVAAEIGALVERLSGETVDLLADGTAANEPADRTADAAGHLCGGVADLPGDAEAAAKRRRNGQRDRKSTRLNS